MEATILSWVTHYGYIGVFSLLMFGIVGLPVPDETLLALAGYLVSKGDLDLVPTFLAAFAGSTCGITVSYTVGRTLGTSVVRKYGHHIHVTEEQLERVKAWFERLGKITLIIGYFVPGFRHLVALVAGGSKLPWITFASFAYSGAFIWAASFITLGYTVGEEWQTILFRLQLPIVVASLGLVLVLLLFLWRTRRSS